MPNRANSIVENFGRWWNQGSQLHDFNLQYKLHLIIEFSELGTSRLCYILSLLAQDTSFMTKPFRFVIFTRTFYSWTLYYSLFRVLFFPDRQNPPLLSICLPIRTLCFPSSFPSDSDPGLLFITLVALLSEANHYWSNMYSHTDSLAVSFRFYAGLFPLASLPVKYLRSSPSEGATQAWALC